MWTWQFTMHIMTPSISLYKPLVGNSRSAASWGSTQVSAVYLLLIWVVQNAAFSWLVSWMFCPTFLLLQCSPPFPEEPRLISLGQFLSEDSKMVKFDACKRVKFLPPLFSHLLCLSNSKIVFLMRESHQYFWYSNNQEFIRDSRVLHY